MKKLLLLLVLFILTIFCVPVKAQEYELNTLIPLDEVATVHTDKFDYINFSISSKLTEKGYRTIKFKSIHNNMITKVPVSINILLFNKEEINIGYLTYCSDKDFETDYSAYKLKGGESSSFSIRVTSTYLGKEYVPEDVSYIAVADDNKYCHIGGYTQYVGQTLEKILGLEEEKTEHTHFFDGLSESILSFFKSKIFVIIVIVIVGLIVFLGYGVLLSSLYQRMYTHKSIVAFIPVVDVYVTVKLVFGNIIAIIYGGLCIVSGILFYFNIPILLYIVIGIWVLSVLLVIVKLLTKNYDLFYFEPAIDSSKYHTETVSNLETEEDSLLDEGAVDISMGSNQNVNSGPAGIDDVLKSLEDSDGTDNDLSKFY